MNKDVKAATKKNKKRQKKYLTKEGRSDIIEKLSLRKRSLVFENWTTIKTRSVREGTLVKSKENQRRNKRFGWIFVIERYYEEFDPGSGLTLAACITHSSRTERYSPWVVLISGGRVSNAWVTCLWEGNNTWKRVLIPHKA